MRCNGLWWMCGVGDMETESSDVNKVSSICVDSTGVLYIADHRDDHPVIHYRPSMGLPTSTTPGFILRSFFLPLSFHRRTKKHFHSLRENK